YTDCTETVKSGALRAGSTSALPIFPKRVRIRGTSPCKSRQAGNTQNCGLFLTYRWRPDAWEVATNNNRSCKSDRQFPPEAHWFRAFPHRTNPDSALAWWPFSSLADTLARPSFLQTRVFPLPRLLGCRNKILQLVLCAL